MVSTYDNGGRWRELGAPEVRELDTARRKAADRASPSERYLEPVSEGASAAKPLGLVWVITSYPLVAAGLEKALEDRADVRLGGSAPAGAPPSCVVFYADGAGGGLDGALSRVREVSRGAPLLVFGPHLDLDLARAALENGADGFVHAAMDREQVVKAVEVAQKGELVAPRQLLRYILTKSRAPSVDDLSPRQREILVLVAEGLSNAEIAGRLYLSESTIKQHLRAAYKLLGVHTRAEAAKMLKSRTRDP
jgi:DNA-binding NarL/FixJ family response regulator